MMTLPLERGESEKQKDRKTKIRNVYLKQLHTTKQQKREGEKKVK